MTNVIQLFIIGTLLGGVYALMASGLTLIFGVMRIVNLAHAIFIFMGAYLAYGMFLWFGMDPFVSLIVTIPAMFLVGAGVYLLLFPRLEGSPRFTESTVLLSFGVAIIIEGIFAYLFTGIYRLTTPSYGTGAYRFGGIFVPQAQLYAAAVSAVLLLLLGALLFGTRTGHSIRATMQNRMAAQIVGVNVRRASTIAFGVGIALAGASGSLVSFLFTFFPSGHWQWIAILLSLIVLGGMGSLKGALIGALVLSIIAAYVSNWLGPMWSPMTFFLALFLTLLIRPQGLYGKPMEV
ncbi:MAG: branched-chain amino acid ABC transporter permease [Nitriliruptoraceae bacterium]